MVHKDDPRMLSNTFLELFIQQPVISTTVFLIASSVSLCIIYHAIAMEGRRAKKKPRTVNCARGPKKSVGTISFITTLLRIWMKTGTTDADAITNRLREEYASFKYRKDLKKEVQEALTLMDAEKGVSSFQKKRQREESEGLNETKRTFHFEDLGGLDSAIQDIRELVELPVLHPEVFTVLGVPPPRGILLFGPPGTGKTQLALTTAQELGISFFKLNGPEILGALVGSSEGRLRQLFNDAKEKAPSLIFIDEIDAITQKRETSKEGYEQRIVAQLLTCMDDIQTERSGTEDFRPVIVLAATNRPDSLDSALRRAGRFDREICIGIPDKNARCSILKAICHRIKLENDFDIKKLAEKTPGYVGADLAALVKEALMICLRRNILMEKETGARVRTPEGGNSEKDLESRRIVTDALRSMQSPLSGEFLRKLTVTKGDFLMALDKVQPSAMREGFSTIPNVTWNDVGALKHTKNELEKWILNPLKDPERYISMGIPLSIGVLLFGPPGNGKTLIAKAVANESEANFISIKGPELMSRFIGDSEKAVRNLFSRARASAPCVIFFDEIDALCPRRGGGISTKCGENGTSDSDTSTSDRVVNQLLSEMDGMKSSNHIIVLAATNRPDRIDPAILRPGRLDKVLFISMPSEYERESILRSITGSYRLDSGVDLHSVAWDSRCSGFSGADLGSLVREAGILALGESPDDEHPYIKCQHFNEALNVVKRSISMEEEKMYVQVASDFDLGV